MCEAPNFCLRDAPTEKRVRQDWAKAPSAVRVTHIITPFCREVGKQSDRMPRSLDLIVPKELSPGEGKLWKFGMLPFPVLTATFPLEEDFRQNKDRWRLSKLKKCSFREKVTAGTECKKWRVKNSRIVSNLKVMRNRPACEMLWFRRDFKGRFFRRDERMFIFALLCSFCILVTFEDGRDSKHGARAFPRFCARFLHPFFSPRCNYDFWQFWGAWRARGEKIDEPWLSGRLAAHYRPIRVMLNKIG